MVGWILHQVARILSLHLLNDHISLICTLIYNHKFFLLIIHFLILFWLSVTKESIVDVEGIVTPVEQKITSATQEDVEIQIEKVCQVTY